MDEFAVPILPSRDLYETLAFYQRLGFVQRGAPIERFRYLIIGRGTVELHFWEALAIDPLTTEFSCYIRVTDADRLYAEWDQIGVASDATNGSRLMAPWDTDYGCVSSRSSTPQATCCDSVRLPRPDVARLGQRSGMTPEPRGAHVTSR